ncbi:MAG: sugar phosphate isomerase/epimerase family protein [Aestuariivirga sp.]
MTIEIGNAPCSWGVEFADDARNPTWQTVLKECAEAGYKGIELGPVGFMPEDPVKLGEGLAQHGLELIGGVVFSPFHDASKWDEVKDASIRTCKALKAHGAKHLVLIDSTAGAPWSRTAIRHWMCARRMMRGPTACSSSRSVSK